MIYILGPNFEILILIGGELWRGHKLKLGYMLL